MQYITSPFNFSPFNNFILQPEHLGFQAEVFDLGYFLILTASKIALLRHKYKKSNRYLKEHNLKRETDFSFRKFGN